MNIGFFFPCDLNYAAFKIKQPGKQSRFMCSLKGECYALTENCKLFPLVELKKKNKKTAKKVSNKMQSIQALSASSWESANMYKKICISKWNVKSLSTCLKLKEIPMELVKYAYCLMTF